MKTDEKANKLVNLIFQQILIAMDVTNANGVYAFLYNDNQVTQSIQYIVLVLMTNNMTYACTDVHPKQRWYLQEHI